MARKTVSTLVVEVSSNIREALSGLNKVGERAARMGKNLRRTGFRMSRTFTAPLAAIGGAALKVSADFEKSMNRVRGLTGATGREFEKLEQLAKDLGETTQFSASESADAMGFLAQAGFETTEILKALPDVLNLAAAGQMDVAETADIASNILTGFGKEADELAEANDALVKTFTSSNTNIQQLGEAFEVVGPIASDVGISFEETAAALGVLGDAGIQGQKAGTALSRMLSRLLNPVPKVKQAINDLGLTMEDVNPTTNTLTEIIGRLEGAGAGASEVLQIFGERGKAIAPLIAQGEEAIASMTETVRDSGGAAQEMADVQMEGLSGAMRELKSAAEGLLIAIAESGLLKGFTGLIDRVTGLVRRLTDLNPTVLRVATVIGVVVAAIGPLLLGLGTALKVVPLVTAAMGSLGAAFTVMTGPIGAVVAAVAGLTFAWIKWGDEIKAVLAPVLERVRSVFGAIMEAIRPLLGLLKSIGQAWWSYVELLAAVAVRVGEIMLQITRPFREVLKPVVMTVFNAIGTIVTTTVDLIREQLIGRFAGIVNAVKEKVDAVRGFFENLKDRVVGNSIIPDMMDGIGAEFGRLEGEMVKPAERASEGIGAAFGQAAQRIGNEFVSMAQRGKFSIKNFVSTSIRQLTKLITQKAFQMLFGSIGGPLGGILGGLVGGLFGGLFAEGGFLPAGQVGIVGEAGPEVVRATSTGVHIEPVGRGGGGRTERRVGPQMAAAGGGGQQFTVRPDLSGLPDPPRAMTPDAVAVDTWWREAFSRLAIDARDRGAL